MVQPRPGSVTLDDPTCEVITSKPDISSKQHPLYLDAGAVAFFLYAGWSISDHIPTNRCLFLYINSLN